MSEFITKRSLYRTRAVRSITRTMQPIVSKHYIDFRVDEGETANRKSMSGRQRSSIRSVETVLDRIILKLKRDYKAKDILLIITPASRHTNLYKLHVIQRHTQRHLGMTTITHKELSRLKSSKAFQKYSIVFGSRYLDLKTMVLQTETIKSLVNSLNKKCCARSNDFELPAKSSLNVNKSNTSSAGDYVNSQLVASVKYQDSFIQTDPEIADNKAFSLAEIKKLLDDINHTLPARQQNIEHFFYMADNMKFTLVVRPDLFWKSASVANNSQQNKKNFLMESYLPGNCYLGSFTILEDDLLQFLDLYPKLLCSIHVIEDVYEITPLPKQFVDVLRKVFGFLKLELFYDALGEFVFDWYKNLTFL